MDFKFNKDSDVKLQQNKTVSENVDQKVIIEWLIIIVCVFSYVYVVYAVIKPKSVPKPVAVAQVAKIPLPPMDAVAVVPPKAEPPKVEQAAPVTAAPPKTEPPKTIQTTPVTTAPPKSELPKVTQVAPAPVTPPATKAPVPPPAQPPAKPVPAVQKTPVADAKPVVAVNKPEPAKAAEVKKVVAETGSKPKAPPVKSEKAVKVEAGSTGSEGTWMIMVDRYVREDTLSNDMSLIRKAGFEPVIKPVARKKTAMNRLLVSEFTDRAEARAALEKLKHITSDAFIIDHAGKHSVYAGSYMQETLAISEKDRLVAAGFAVTIKRTDIAIPSKSLTVGPFNGKKAAASALKKLKDAGVKATLSRL